MNVTAFSTTPLALSSKRLICSSGRPSGNSAFRYSIAALIPASSASSNLAS
jgi:hypothetical protein